MISHFALFLVVGAFYYTWLVSVLTVAARIGELIPVVFIACVLLGSVAAPLSLLQARYASFVAIVSLLPISAWAVGLGIQALSSPREALFVPLALGPAGCALYVAIRSAYRPPTPRLQVPALVRYPLAAVAAIPGVLLAIRVVSNVVEHAAA